MPFSATQEDIAALLAYRALLEERWPAPVTARSRETQHCD
jgi:hypothetical protein